MMSRSFVVGISLFALAGCLSESPSNDVTTSGTAVAPLVQAVSESAAFTESRDFVLAKVGDEQITQATIDEIVKLRLYDLEWAKYEIRVKALSELIDQKRSDQKVSTGPVEVLIEPPMPPRLNIGPTDGQPSYGNASAPIEIGVFCSYPSVHCSRMMRTYNELIELYPGQLKFVFFDFPQAFHFNAGHAARAARCAHEGGQFWPYHKGLLASYDQLKTVDTFVRMARQVNLDTEKFKTCMESNKFMDEVKANIGHAEKLGLSKVPVTLVNGLFVNGPKSVDTMRYFIDMELSRLGLQQVPVQSVKSSTVEEIPLSELPLRLEGISLHQEQHEATATIQHVERGTSQLYHQDDTILDGVFLVMIERNAIIVENAGKLERILLSAGQVEELNAPLLATSEPKMKTEGQVRMNKTSLADPDEIPAGLEFTYRGIVEAKGDTPLSRTWLEEQLIHREQLREHFEPAELEVEGTYLMRLTGVSENEFYQTLGLQESDVVMRVNNQWVHSAQNSLFETLESEPEVSVVLMRKGLPVHLKYAIN